MKSTNIISTVFYKITTASCLPRQCNSHGFCSPLASLPQIQPLVRTSGYRRFVLCSTLGHVGGSNSCGGYTLMGVAMTHAG